MLARIVGRVVRVGQVDGRVAAAGAARAGPADDLVVVGLGQLAEGRGRLGVLVQLALEAPSDGGQRAVAVDPGGAWLRPPRRARSPRRRRGLRRRRRRRARRRGCRPRWAGSRPACSSTAARAPKSEPSAARGGRPARDAHDPSAPGLDELPERIARRHRDDVGAALQRVPAQPRASRRSRRCRTRARRDGPARPSRAAPQRGSRRWARATNRATAPRPGCLRWPSRRAR